MRRDQFLVRIVRIMDQLKVACDRASHECNHYGEKKNYYHSLRIEEYLIMDHRKKNFSEVKRKTIMAIKSLFSDSYRTNRIFHLATVLENKKKKRIERERE